MQLKQSLAMIASYVWVVAKLGVYTETCFLNTFNCSNTSGAKNSHVTVNPAGMNKLCFEFS